MGYVISGVSQGSVLGPILFAIYVKDMPSVVSSTVKAFTAFTDDTMLYHTVSGDYDRKELWEDTSTGGLGRQMVDEQCVKM